MPDNAGRSAAVIGAGPAGIAAAVQLRRFGIDTLIFEKEKTGGLVRSANLVENYPGFPDGIPGPELADRFARHLLSSGASVVSGEVLSLEYAGGSFAIKTEKDQYQAGFAVIASGTAALRPEGVEISRGAEPFVFTEIISISDLEGKKIAVIGSGDAAFDYALNLSKKNDLYIIMRGSEPRCLPLLLERAHSNRRIEIIRRFDSRKVEKYSSGLLITGKKEGVEGESLTTDRLLFAVGREPATGFFGRGLSKNIDLLSREGILYLVGDVKNGIFRQTAIAAGDGIKAAMAIEKVISRV
ncbi:MAG: NAD(P)/FAD-dependent oxidoreductase [Candidatus Krumholzibacteriota bacterium]|nr:NAD(P)/FAD-dependent oxidoreductase [Candidatus Krumholzibacteriota bacterium]